MNTNNFYYLLTGLLFLITSSCKKKDPQAQGAAPTPVFSFNGTINNSPVNMQAGMNGYYMFSSYALDGNGVYDFTGELKPYSCPSNCASSLKIYLKDYRQYSLLATTIDSSIIPGYCSFATPAGTSSKFYVKFFDTLYSGTAQTYTWNFGDGGTSNQHRPIHQYNRPGIYNVSFSTQSTTSCSSSLNNNVFMGQTGNAFQVVFGGTGSGNVVSFGTSVGGIPPYIYNWDFGDGNTSTAPSPTHTYSASGVYAVTFSVTDASGYTAVCRANTATQTTTICHTNFYPTSTTPVPNPTNLSGVTIEWRDASGNLYTSFNNAQSSKSSFQILSVDSYQNNASGQSTKKIHAKISCTLYLNSANILLTGDVVFAVAHL